MTERSRCENWQRDFVSSLSILRIIMLGIPSIHPLRTIVEISTMLASPSPIQIDLLSALVKNVDLHKPSGEIDNPSGLSQGSQRQDDNSFSRRKGCAIAIGNYLVGLWFIRRPILKRACHHQAARRRSIQSFQVCRIIY
jgi:hypothetical protein